MNIGREDWVGICEVLGGMWLGLGVALCCGEAIGGGVPAHSCSSIEPSTELRGELHPPALSHRRVVSKNLCV